MDDEKINQLCCKIQPNIDKILLGFEEILQKYGITENTVVSFTLSEVEQKDIDLPTNTEGLENLSFQTRALVLPQGCVRVCFQVGSSERCGVICPS